MITTSNITDIAVKHWFSSNNEKLRDIYFIFLEMTSYESALDFKDL